MQAFTPHQLERATLNRLEAEGYDDGFFDSLGELESAHFLNEYVIETARDFQVEELAGMQMAGIGSKLKKAVKKVKSAVKKTVRTVAKPIKKINSTLGRKLLPGKIQSLGRKIDRAVIRPALLPVTVAYKTPSEVKAVIKQSASTASAVLLPDAIAQAAKKFEQKHRPLLKQIAFTVAGVVASMIVGPGAMSLVQIATESIKQLAFDLATQKLQEKYIRIQAKKDAKEIAAEMEALNAEILAMQTELEPQIMRDLQNNAPALIDQHLDADTQAYISAKYAEQGPAWLESAEAQSILQPITGQLSAYLTGQTSANPLAPLAAENLVNEEAASAKAGPAKLIMAALAAFTLLK